MVSAKALSIPPHSPSPPHPTHLPPPPRYHPSCLTNPTYPPHPSLETSFSPSCTCPLALPPPLLTPIPHAPSSDAHHPGTTAPPPLCLTLHSTTHHPRHQPSFTFHGNCFTSPFTSSLLSYPPSTAHPETEGQPQPLQEVKRCPSQQLHHRRLSNYTYKEWGPSTYHFIYHSCL